MAGRDRSGAVAARHGLGVALPERPVPSDLSALQRSLWEALVAEPQHVDALVAAAGAGGAGGAGADASAVLAALTELEMRGLVKQQPGMRFGVA